MASVGERIKKRRKELGLSVDTLAEILGKNRATIYRYESEDIENMPTTILEPLAVALQTTPAMLMGWKENNNFSHNLNFLMIDYKYTIPILSKLTNITTTKIKRFLDGIEDPTMEEIKSISECFSIKPSELLNNHFDSIGKVYFDDCGNTTMSFHDEIESVCGYGMRQIVELAGDLNVDGFNKVIEYINDLSDRYRKG